MLVPVLVIFAYFKVRLVTVTQHSHRLVALAAAKTIVVIRIKHTGQQTTRFREERARVIYTDQLVSIFVKKCALRFAD